MIGTQAKSWAYTYTEPPQLVGKSSSCNVHIIRTLLTAMNNRMFSSDLQTMAFTITIAFQNEYRKQKTWLPSTSICLHDSDTTIYEC